MLQISDLPVASQDAVIRQTTRALGELRRLVREKSVRTFDDIRRAMAETPFDEDSASGVPVDQRLLMIEMSGDDACLAQIDVSFEELTQAIDETASQIIRRLAIDRARELVGGLERICSEFGFEATDLRSENELDPSPHTREEEPAENCVAYHYHHIGTGEPVAEIWEYTFPGTELSLYLNGYIDAEADWEDVFNPW